MPSLVAPLAQSSIDADMGAHGSAALKGGVLKPVDFSFLARVGRLLDGLRRPSPGRPGDTSWRNPSPVRDFGRDRDATSFGLRGVPISTTGAFVAGLGLGAGAVQLLDLGKVSKKLPFKLGPTACQGGGGIALKARW